MVIIVTMKQHDSQEDIACPRYNHILKCHAVANLI